jgi:hypothetical protein
MTEARIGRLVAACLHQAIADELPNRLEFYEHWLKSETLRDGTIGMAPLAAVLGFLRAEGDGHARVMTRAGLLAAEWTMASMSAARRAALGWLPRRFRARAALRIVSELVRATYTASRATARIRQGQARLEVKTSLFCAARETPRAPLCGFYLAAATEVFRALDLPSHGHLQQCCAIDRGPCVMTLDLAGVSTAPAPAIAA